MKTIKQKKMVIIIILLLCSLCFNLAFAVSGSAPEPGSEQDPIVSKSYVDKCIEGIQAGFIKKLTDEIETLKKEKSPDATGFEVVSIEKGQIIYTGSGTELILRSGKADAVKGEGGGLSDTTSAKDLTNGMALSANHLLISAREDGRGAIAYSKCWLLVRGSYRVEEKTKESEVSVPDKPKLLGTVTASILNVRAQPDTKAKILIKLKRGDSIEISEKKEGWYEIVTSEGVTGWVAEEYVALS